MRTIYVVVVKYTYVRSVLHTNRLCYQNVYHQQLVGSVDVLSCVDKIPTILSCYIMPVCSTFYIFNNSCSVYIFINHPIVREYSGCHQRQFSYIILEALKYFNCDALQTPSKVSNFTVRRAQKPYLKAPQKVISNILLRFNKT